MALTVVSWNVNSLRSVMRKGFCEWLEETAPDIVCLQEVRATLEQLRPLESAFKGYQAIWHPAERPGYAGTAILTRFAPMAVERGLNGGQDVDGRALTVDFGNFRVASLYAHNAVPETPKIGLKRTWFETLGTHVHARSEKPFVVAGDLNVAFESSDSKGIPHPFGMNGCTDDEREAMQVLLDRTGLYDPHRERAGDAILSTWWPMHDGERFCDLGIRFDYALIQKGHAGLVRDSAIHASVFGSDHCPTSVTLDLAAAPLGPIRPSGQTTLFG